MIGWASTKKWHIIKYNPLILSNKVFYAFLNQFQIKIDKWGIRLNILNNIFLDFKAFETR